MTPAEVESLHHAWWRDQEVTQPGRPRCSECGKDLHLINDATPTASWWLSGYCAPCRRRRLP
jgi:hypothetical protein